MNGTEMIRSFGVNYASEINNAVAGFTDDEILEYLNQAQDDIIMTLSDSKAWTKIESLRTKATLGISGLGEPIYPNAVTTTITFTYFTLAKIFALTDRTMFPVANDSWIECDDFNLLLDDLDKYTVNDLNKPIYEVPKWIKQGEDIMVLYDTYSTVTNIAVEYIRIPAAIELLTTSEVHTSYHPKIVDRAVTIALEALGNPRIQTQPTIAT